MTSKVLVKLPTVPFSQGKKSPLELVPMPNRLEGSNNQSRQRNIYGDSVAQLEQSMKFLQEQHQLTLVALHQEVENLRQRNRDLQFQLVFSKSNNTSVSTSNPSSPEDNGNGFMKSKGSPVCVNSIPLQVELLEKEIQDIKSSLNESKTQNLHLNEIIEQQKKMLESTVDKTETMVDIGVQVDGGMYRTQPGLVTRLQEAEAMVKNLRQENEEQSKEIAAMKATLAIVNNHPAGSSRGRRSHNHNSRPTTSEGSQDENSYKFPPLQSQSYWHRGSKGNHNFEHRSHSDYHRNEKNRHDQKQERKSCDDESVLPQLRNSTNKGENDSASYPPFYRSRGYHSGNYYNGNKKYRGNRSQRRDQDGNGHQRREFKDREQKHSRAEYSDSAEGTKDCKTTRKP